MTPEEILSKLNPEQAKAASTIDGPVLVLAGAGTGKTRVITFRIAYMLARGVDPESILGLTFTNKAAREMRERLGALVGQTIADKVTLGTFHAFCMQVLKRDIEKLGYLRSFSIADDQDQQGICKQAIAELGWNKDDVPLAAMRNKIGEWKNQLMTVANAREQSVNDFDVSASTLYRAYQKSLEMQNMVDFDDMLLLVYRLFSEFPAVLEQYCSRFKYLLVDEYQDTNDAQFAIVRQLAGSKCNLCVVGDDDQSIYGWRGANIGNILDFPKLFPGTCEVKLEQNYRSCSKILNAANAVISYNTSRHNKKLWSKLGQGEDLTAIECDDGEDEATCIAKLIRQVRSERPELNWSDFAILYRSNHLSRQLEMTLRNEMVPFKLVGGQEFFKRKEVKDAAAYLRMITNPKDNQSLLRIMACPPRGLADKAVSTLKTLFNASHIPMRKLLAEEAFQNSLSGKGATGAKELADAIARAEIDFSTPGDLARKATVYLNEVGYLSGLQKMYKDIDDALKRRENIDEFISSIAQYESKCAEPPTLREYLDSFALSEENDRVEDNAENGDGVILSTVHAAKGLEFPIVFVVAMERDTFPHERAISDGSMEEELRLFYVAITRAKELLFLTCAQNRLIRGQYKMQLNSPFLELLPPENLRKGQPDDILKPLSPDQVKAEWAKLFALLKK